jgi:hypothetical protein
MVSKRPSLLRALPPMLALALCASAASAQDAENHPPGWKLRADRAADNVADVQFAAMAPGWHITTGPHVILYHPDSTATGNYRIESEIFLFDPGQRREGFGIFIGGRDLEGDAQHYAYFLIRQDGQFIIKRRAGADTPTIQGWTEHPAILKWADHGSGATAKNVLAVDVGTDTVVFSVNDTEVHRVPRAELDTDGIVGLRVSHALNLHVSKLAITKK